MRRTYSPRCGAGTRRQRAAARAASLITCSYSPAVQRPASASERSLAGLRETNVPLPRNHAPAAQPAAQRPPSSAEMPKSIHRSFIVVARAGSAMGGFLLQLLERAANGRYSGVDLAARDDERRGEAQHAVMRILGDDAVLQELAAGVARADA